LGVKKSRKISSKYQYCTERNVVENSWSWRNFGFENFTSEKISKIEFGHLKKMGVATNRAKYFIEFESENIFNRLIDEQNFRQIVLNGMKSKWQNPFSEQLSLI
jgi:hypothetical protein